MTPTIGRIVHYQLTVQDAEQINRHRAAVEQVTVGAQAHVGNTSQAGDILPAMIVRVLPGDNVNLQVFLDGNDTLWATTRPPVLADNTSAPGCWHWPARA